jgi:hypothetical protein
LTGRIARAIVAGNLQGALMKLIHSLVSTGLRPSPSSLTRLGALVLLLGGLASCQKGGPLRVDNVEPDQGINAGGDQVIIHGSGFEPGKTQVEIRFGRARAEQVTVDSADKITVVTPPGDKGPVDVTLMFDNGAQFKIAQGFRYVVPSAGEDVRKAFFDKKPGAGQPAPTNTNTTPPAKAK